MRATMAAAVGVVLFLTAGPAMAQAGDAERGARAFNQQCKACHTVEKGGASAIGPNLFGRKAGTTAGFTASSAMAQSKITWDEATLADYLKNPKGKIPGTKMAYMGLKKRDQLDDVIAYLKKATQ